MRGARSDVTYTDDLLEDVQRHNSGKGGNYSTYEQYGNFRQSEQFSPLRVHPGEAKQQARFMRDERERMEPQYQQHQQYSNPPPQQYPQFVPQQPQYPQYPQYPPMDSQPPQRPRPKPKIRMQSSPNTHYAQFDQFRTDPITHDQAYEHIKNCPICSTSKLYGVGGGIGGSNGIYLVIIVILVVLLIILLKKYLDKGKE